MSIQDIKNRMNQDQVMLMFSCPPEWEELIIQLDKDIAKIDPNYKVVQVKQKFGGLRYYIRFTPGLTQEACKKINTLIFAAEEASFALLDWNND